jgi:hypothetical protein
VQFLCQQVSTPKEWSLSIAVSAEKLGINQLNEDDKDRQHDRQQQMGISLKREAFSEVIELPRNFRSHGRPITFFLGFTRRGNRFTWNRVIDARCALPGAPKKGPFPG